MLLGTDQKPSATFPDDTVASTTWERRLSPLHLEM